MTVVRPCTVPKVSQYTPAFPRYLPAAVHYKAPIAVAARSKASVCGRSSAEIVGSNPTGGMDVCREFCVLSGRGLCDELMNRLEESYRLWCVVCVI